VIHELVSVIDDIADSDLAEIVDHTTQDEDCISIQTILTHVVQSGYTYIIEIRKWLGEDMEYMDKITLTSVSDYKIALEEMFAYSERAFSDHPDIRLIEHNAGEKIKVRWGQRFDVEQLMEHAIVHILRHRRQIEKFALILSKRTKERA